MIGLRYYEQESVNMRHSDADVTNVFVVFGAAARIEDGPTSQSQHH